MKSKTPRDKAMLFIAACERPDPDVYERQVVRLSRKWLTIMNSPEITAGVVSKLLEEFEGVDDDEYGSIWTDLKQTVLEWAVGEEWV